MPLWRAAPLVTLTVMLTACDSTDPSAMAPSPVTGLTIEGSDAILAGDPVSYEVFASGTRSRVQAAWTSSDARVATVTPNGVVTGHTHGPVRLEASFEGASSSKTIDVVNNFEGRWGGLATIRQCDETGHILHDWWRCDVLASTGGDVAHGRFSVYFGLVHDTKDVRRVSGTYDLNVVASSVFGACEMFGSPVIALAGHVSSDGRLIVEGAATNWDGSERWIVNAWDTHLTAADKMRGKWAQDLTVASGTAHVEIELAELSKNAEHPCGS